MPRKIVITTSQGDELVVLADIGDMPTGAVKIRVGGGARSTPAPVEVAMTTQDARSLSDALWAAIGEIEGQRVGRRPQYDLSFWAYA